MIVIEKAKTNKLQSRWNSYMRKKELNEEIRRVKNAIAKTESRYLRRDYEKYLKRLMNERKGLRT